MGFNILLILIGLLILWMFKPALWNWYQMKKYQMKRKRFQAAAKKAK